MKISISSLLLSVLIPCVCHAESKIPIMEEVIVSATRDSEEVSTVPANVTVITRQEIEKSNAQNVPELLKLHTGIQVYDITGNKTNYRVDLRGFGESANANTLVLVDGRRTIMPDLSGANWALLLLNQVERIEIIRGGGGSVIYGDNATGGVVNIITRKGDKLSGTASGAYGSYNTFHANANIGGSNNALSYFVAGGYVNTDGYRDHSEMDSKDVGGNFSFTPNDNANISISGGYHKDNVNLPGAITESEFASGASREETTSPLDFSDTEDSYIKVSPEFYFFDNSSFIADISYRNRDTTSFVTGDWGYSDWSTETKTTSISPRLVIKETVSGKKNTFIAGFDFIEAKQDILSQAVFFGASSTNVYELEKKNTGFYIHDRFFITDMLVLSGGYRHDRADYTFTPAIPSGAVLDNDLGNVGATYTYKDKSNIYVSYNKSFRYPLLDELFNFVSIDTSLVAQESDDYEIGIRHSIEDNLWISVALFRINTENEIFYNPIGGPFGFGGNENLDGKTQRDGLELEVKKWFGDVAVTGSYSYTNAEIEDGQYAGNDVPGVPEHKAAVGVDYNFAKGFLISGNGVYIGKRPFESDFAGTLEKQEDYFLFNSKLQYTSGKISMYLDVNNITNKEYSEYGVLNTFTGEKAFYPSPERNILAGVTVTY